MLALVDRIVEAYKSGVTFRVIVVLPLKPEFHGNWYGMWTPDKAYLTEITRLNYQTLFKGTSSLKNQLIQRGGLLPNMLHYNIIYLYFAT